MHLLSLKLAFELLLQIKEMPFGGIRIYGHCFAVHWLTLYYFNQETIKQAEMIYQTLAHLTSFSQTAHLL